MSVATKDQNGKALALVKEKPELLGAELSEADVRQEFSCLQRFGRIVHLTLSGALVMAISWTVLKLLRPDYVFTWADNKCASKPPTSVVGMNCACA